MEAVTLERFRRVHISSLLYFLSLISVLSALMVGQASANVLVMAKNMTLSLSAMEANFASPIDGSGTCGTLHLAKPLDACLSLVNKPLPSKGNDSSFVLIIRGGCNFEDKVRRAQSAGFKAAIVFDNINDGTLVAMAGNRRGINIHAVFVSKASGEVLKKYAGVPGVEFWLVPTFENSAWSIMAISVICLLALSAVLATCFFVRRQRTRQDRPRAPQVTKFSGMSIQSVRAIPSLIFTSVTGDNCTSRTCAICLEDYSVGEKLRILPCHHKFHTICVDAWLTTWRSFCPVCKRNLRTKCSDPPVSECTPLLSSSITTLLPVASSPIQSSLAPSPAIQIASSALMPGAQSLHRTGSRSFLCTPHVRPTIRSHGPAGLSSSRSSLDLRNVPLQRSPAHPILFNPLGLPYIRPSSSYSPAPEMSPNCASHTCGWSSSNLPFHQHNGESAGSL